MDINRARQLAGDMKKLENGFASRLKPGVYTVLFGKIEEATVRATKAPMLRATATVIVPQEDEFNRKADEDGYEGHFKGEEISWTYFFGDYFNTEFGPFLIAGLGLSPSEAADMDSDTIMATFADVVRDSGSNERGILDGTAALELTVRRGAPKKNEETGEMKPGFVSIKQYRHVPIAELADKLSEDDLVRYFGSMENFLALAEG